MLLHKLQYFPCDAGVGTDIATINLPVAQLFDLRILGWRDANSNLCRLAQIRTVERYRRDWPTPQASPGFLAQPFKEAIFHHHIPPRAFSLAVTRPLSAVLLPSSAHARMHRRASREAAGAGNPSSAAFLLQTPMVQCPASL